MPKHMSKSRVGTTQEPTSLRLPRNAPIKHFGFIAGTPFVWYEEVEGQRTTRKNYRAFATGEDIPSGWEYVATAQDGNDASIHLYVESNDF